MTLGRRRLLIALALVLAVGAGLAVAGLRPMLASATPEPASTRSGSRPTPMAAALAWRLGMPPQPTTAVAPPAPEPEGVAPATETPKSEPAFLTARVRVGAGLTMFSRPGGRTIGEVDATTEFGSPQTLSVVERRGRWLAVVSPELPNGEVGWVKLDRRSLQVDTIRMSVRIDLSRRLLVLLRGDEVVRRVRVGIGRPDSPTPTGRFSVTDKLSGAPYGTVYGCCVLALSAHQTRLPAGWKGGDRMAVHGTDEPSTIGAPSSAGCLRAADGDLRYLMSRVPLGTPVFIHP